MNMCVIGGFLASGVIYQEILKDFGESAAASASIVGLQGFFFALFGELPSLQACPSCCIFALFCIISYEYCDKQTRGWGGGGIKVFKGVHTLVIKL